MIKINSKLNAYHREMINCLNRMLQIQPCKLKKTKFGYEMKPWKFNKKKLREFKKERKKLIEAMTNEARRQLTEILEQEGLKMPRLQAHVRNWSMGHSIESFYNDKETEIVKVNYFKEA